MSYTEKADIEFLISCPKHVELPKSVWTNIAADNNIAAGSTTVTAGVNAQRKFRKIITKSEKFTLKDGRVVLKDDAATTTDASSTPPTTTTKKRGIGRPGKEATESDPVKKKVKKANVTDDTGNDGDDEE